MHHGDEPWTYMHMQSSVLKTDQTSAVTVGGKRKVNDEEIELKKNQFAPESVVFVNNNTQLS